MPDINLDALGLRPRTQLTMADMTDYSSTSQPKPDLHGSIANIQGFAGEAACAADRLGRLLANHESRLPPDFASAVTVILREDLLPCHQLLDTAIAVLEHRLHKLDDDSNPCIAQTR